MKHPIVKVTLLDGSTREFNSWNDYYNIANTLTLHSYNDKPAYIDCYNDGSISYQAWYKEGKLHREDDKPAIISYNNDGSIHYQYWYKEGKYHREDVKPAFISYNNDGTISYQAWYKEGKEITKEEAKAYNQCKDGHNYRETFCGDYKVMMCCRCFKVKEE